MKLILASTSPYRKALLEQLHLPFVTHDSEVDEEKYKREISDPIELTKCLALEKAKSVHQKFPEAIVIGGDQVSVHNKEILGKPGTRENAVDQLLKLQGSTHQLVTATCVFDNTGKSFEWIETINLSMRPLNREQATKYVEIDEPLFCAGSYKIESLGISLFDKIDCEDQSAIVGLPLLKLASILRSLGLDPLN